MKTEKFELTIKRNDEQEIKSLTLQNRDSTVFLSDPIQKCEIQGVTYDGKMNADDFVSIDNVATGQTLTVGNSVIVGTIKEDGSTVTFNGQPVQIGADKKFSITTNINEGLNTVNFEALCRLSSVLPRLQDKDLLETTFHDAVYHASRP